MNVFINDVLSKKDENEFKEFKKQVADMKVSNLNELLNVLKKIEREKDFFVKTQSEKRALINK